MPAQGHPLAHVGDYVLAYHRPCHLGDLELDVLYPLIISRLVMTVAITEWRATLHPENRAYILRNNPAAWEGLLQAARLPYEQARVWLRDRLA